MKTVLPTAVGAAFDRARSNLQRFVRNTVEPAGLRKAAVAVVLGPQPDGDGDGDELCFLLTLRSSRLRQHAGQWALPGGRVDVGETVVEAALRELDEELGLRLNESAVIGLLDDYPTRSGYLISPVVLFAESAESAEDFGSLRPNHDEVAEVHRISLSSLASAPRDLFPTENPNRPVLSIDLPQDIVFTPTAAILHQLDEVVSQGRATRVFHFDQPRFAWA